VRPAALGALIGTLAGALLWSCTVQRVSDGYTCSSNADCALDRVCTQGYCVIGQNPLLDAPRPDAAVCPAICNNTCDFTKGTCMIVGTGSGNIACPAGWHCNIECGTAGACGTLNCTNAASCTIECTANNACLGITCGTKNCDVTCTGHAACGNINCTSGNCTADCSGGGGSAACGSLSCNSGNCAATCSGSNACGSVTCGTGDCSETCAGGSAACGTLNCGTGACAATCTGLEPACGTVNCANSCKCDVGCNGTTNACPAAMNCPDRAPGADYCTVDGANGSRCSSSFAQQCNNC
jgi:hypothetical protein